MIAGVFIYRLTIENYTLQLWILSWLNAFVLGYVVFL